MPDSKASTGTLEDEGPAMRRLTTESKLDLSGLPPTFILTTNTSTQELHEAEDELSNRGAPITYDIKEANLILGNVSKARRAKLELQWVRMLFKSCFARLRQLDEAVDKFHKL